MNKQRIIEALNKARADELAVIIQYMKHHYEMVGPASPAIADVEKDTAKEEMKHAERLGERIDYLGGVPTPQPSPIKQGGTLEKMVQDDLDSENDAIAKYKGFIKLAEEEDDPVTRLMLEEILSDEEDHAYQFATILGKVGQEEGARRTRARK